MAAAAAAAAGGREREARDEVTLNAIQRETIRKENRCQRLITEFTINPHHKIHAVTGKPMAWHDNQTETTDESFLKIFHHTSLEPSKKYTEPQTSSQEIGWITQPLITFNWTDHILTHHRKKTEITAYMEAAWKLKEQSVNLQ